MAGGEVGVLEGRATHLSNRRCIMRRLIIPLVISSLIASAGCGYDNNGPSYDPGDSTNVVGSSQVTVTDGTIDRGTFDLVTAGLGSQALQHGETEDRGRLTEGQR